MGRPSITGGVRPAGPDRIQLDFTIDGVRYRPTLPWRSHETNLRRARGLLANIKLRIAAGTFDLLSEFPEFRYRGAARAPLRTRTCSDVFDLFLRHEDMRVALGDLASTTLAASPVARSRLATRNRNPAAAWCALLTTGCCADELRVVEEDL